MKLIIYESLIDYDRYWLLSGTNELRLVLKFFKENPDYKNPAYSSKYGIYEERCGLDNVAMSWGHDDYMYMVNLKFG